MTNEQDIDLLETYLDGALDASENAAVEQRLADQPEFAAELKRLEDGRKLRMQLWQSYEPAPESADRILAGIKAKESRRSWFMRVLDNRERIAAAAACIAVFLIGWQWGRNVNAYRMIPAGGTGGQPVSLITQEQVPSGKTTVYEVRVTDSSGKLVRTERFANIADAQRFIEQVKSQMLKGNPEK